MAELVRYQSLISDSARWAGFAFRPGDIVISTPPKSGTTWMQMLCALLVFDDPDFDGTLSDISPWLDMLTRPLRVVTAGLAAQRHRRFIKTHTPLDGVPHDPRVTYLCVGRDPRDIAFSWDNHRTNLNFESVMAERVAAVGLADVTDLSRPPAPIDPLDRFWDWVGAESSPGANASNLAAVLHHLHIAWERRAEPNVVLFHFSDMLADLPGELGRLAAVLHLDVTSTRLATLADAASFARMKARSAQLAPRGATSHWHSTDRFFDKGPGRCGQDLLDVYDEIRYERRVADLVNDPEFVTWVHGGRRAARQL